MFTDKELKGTEDFCECKIEDVLNGEGGSDTDYIRNLQTLITLKDAANQRVGLGAKNRAANLSIKTAPYA